MLRDFPDGLGQARTVDDGKLVLSVWSQPTFAVKDNLTPGGTNEITLVTWRLRP